MLKSSLDPNYYEICQPILNQEVSDYKPWSFPNDIVEMPNLIPLWLICCCRNPGCPFIQIVFFYYFFYFSFRLCNSNSLFCPPTVFSKDKGSKEQLFIAINNKALCKPPTHPGWSIETTCGFFGQFSTFGQFCTSFWRNAEPRERKVNASHHSQNTSLGTSLFWRKC